MSPGGRPSDPAGAAGRRFRDTFGLIILKVAPVGIGVLAYWLAGRTEADLNNIRYLLQVALGLIVGVAAYTIIAETTLSRLPRRLARELEVLAKELTPLREAVAELSTTVNEQLRSLIDLHGVEILYDEEAALVRARALQNNAARSIHAMWTKVPYDDALRQYFSETLAAGPFASRIVAARSVPIDHLLDHIDQTWDLLADGRYEIHLVPDCDYEALVVDRETAALFFYPSKGYGNLFVTSPTRQFVSTVEGLMNGLRREEWRLPIESYGHKDIASARDWLDDYYRNLPPA